MGDTVRKRMGSQVEVRYQCIDSAGLQLIRIVANGKPVKELRPTDDKVLKGSYKMKFKSGHSYHTREVPRQRRPQGLIPIPSIREG